MIKDAVEEALEQQRRMILNESVSIKSVLNIEEPDDDINDNVVSASKYTNAPTTVLNSIQKLTITSRTNEYIKTISTGHKSPIAANRATNNDNWSTSEASANS
jgi:hypothetical protein